MRGVDHIGIAVKSIDRSLDYYTKTLSLSLIRIEEVASQQVKVAFLDAGNIKIELLEGMSANSPITKFIDSKGEGIHHIAFQVKDIRSRMQQLKNEGVQVLAEEPSIGAGGAEVAFLHPKSSFGVLYELCERPVKEE